MSDRFEQRLERLADVQVPLPPTVAQLRERDRRRSARRTRAGLAAVALITVALGAAVMDGRGADGPLELETATAPADLIPPTTPASPADGSGGTVGVTNGEGVYVGTIVRRDVDARDERILERLVEGFREPVGPADDEYDRLWTALSILDPVPVTDDRGETVGYWVGRFMTPDELSGARDDAEATVRDLLGD